MFHIMQTPLQFAIDNRLPEIADRVGQLMPAQKSEAGINPLDQLLYGVLAQGLSSSSATASYRRLRKAYPRFADLRDAEPEAIRTLMVGIPAAALKAAAIPEILRLVEDAFGCLSLDGLARLDTAMAESFLTRLPRVTEEIASTVMRFAGKERLVLHVDREVARVLRRLALCEPAAPLSAVPRQLIERAPTGWRQDDFAGLSRGLTRVADRFCHQGRPDCGSCPLASLCPGAEKARPSSEVVVSFPFGRKVS
jgi:endonuclease-3